MAYDKEIAALTVYCEASGEPPAARRAVMHSIFNRQRTGAVRYGATIAAVCLKRAQYSEWDGDTIDNRNLERAACAAASDPAMVDCAAAYDEVAGGAPDPTGGATHFYADSIRAPYWTTSATACGKIGRILFWKDVP